MAHRRRNRTHKMVTVFASGLPDEFRTIRIMDGATADRLILQKRAVSVYSRSDAFLGIRLTDNASGSVRRADAAKVVVVGAVPVGLGGSNTAFSRGEIAAIAGTAFVGGRSRTAGMKEDERAERIRRGWRGEDLAERARAKFDCYAATH